MSGVGGWVSGVGDTVSDTGCSTPCSLMSGVGSWVSGVGDAVSDTDSDSGFSTSSPFPTSISVMRHLGDLNADDHRAKVVPSALDHLRNMNDEESHVADGDPEVEEAGHL